MAIKFSNNAKTTVSSAVSTTDTSISVADASDFPTLGAGTTPMQRLLNYQHQLTWRSLKSPP